MVKVAEELFSSSSDRSRFLDAIQAGDAGAQACLWLRGRPESSPFKEHVGPAWLPRNVQVVSPEERPGKSPEHEEGGIYCLDLSSVFACVPLYDLNNCKSVIDVCAAPGGKGIVAWSAVSPAFIAANEVIRKRTAQLISNYRRCHIAPSIVTAMDPKQLAEQAPSSADLVIVDAPCSGQSLVLKDLAAPGAFHPATISMNARRQRRILAHSAALVAPGGYLLYATCTFSKEENEENVEWLLSHFSEFAAQPVDALEEYRSPVSSVATYRLWPYQGWGAGSFCALFKRADSNYTGNDIPLTEIFTQGVVWRSGVAPVRAAVNPRRREFSPKGKQRDKKKLRPSDYE